MDIQDMWAIWPISIEQTSDKVKDIMSQVSVAMSHELGVDVTYIVSPVMFDPMTLTPNRILVEVINNGSAYAPKSTVVIPELWFETLQDIDAIYKITNLIAAELYPHLLVTSEDKSQ